MGISTHHRPHSTTPGLVHRWRRLRKWAHFIVEFWSFWGQWVWATAPLPRPFQSEASGFPSDHRLMYVLINLLLVFYRSCVTILCLHLTPNKFSKNFRLVLRVKWTEQINIGWSSAICNKLLQFETTTIYRRVWVVKTASKSCTFWIPVNFRAGVQLDVWEYEFIKFVLSPNFLYTSGEGRSKT